MNGFKIKHHKEFESNEIVRIDSKFNGLSTKDKTRVLDNISVWVERERLKIIN